MIVPVLKSLVESTDTGIAIILGEKQEGRNYSCTDYTGSTQEEKQYWKDLLSGQYWNKPLMEKIEFILVSMGTTRTEKYKNKIRCCNDASKITSYPSQCSIKSFIQISTL